MGRMGKSMVYGWLNSGLSANKIQIIDPNISINDDFITENDLSIKCLEEIDPTQGTIVIAVKPQVVENVLITLREKLTSETTIISIVAGYSTKDIRNITAVSGSGPAYYYLLTECLIEIASSCGLEKDIAALLVEQTFTGSAALAETFPNISPTQHRQNVTSPGGTTEAALKILMEDDKLKGLLDLAINSAVERSKNLSK